MITYNQYCKYFGEWPQYSEVCVGVLQSVKYACLDVFNDPDTPKIEKKGSFETFVQIIFNWSHHNECSATKEGKITPNNYYSHELKTFGTTSYKPVDYFSRVAGVHKSTGHAWIKILIQKGLLDKRKTTNGYGHTYYLLLDKLKKIAERTKANFAGLTKTRGSFFSESHPTNLSDEPTNLSDGTTKKSNETTTLSDETTKLSDKTTIQIYNKKEKKEVINNKSGARIGDVDPNSSFSFSQEEDSIVKSQLNVENRSSTSEVKNLIVQPEKKLSLPSSSKKEEVKIIADKPLSIQEPPYPPLTKTSTPGTKEESTAEKPKLALLHLNTNEQNAYGFREAAEKYRLVYSKNYHKNKATVEAVKGNECLYYITWTETGEKFLYVADYLASSTVRCSENYWRADYLSWTWEKEACWWTKLKQAKNTQSAIYELAQMHSKWLSDPYNEKYISCLSNRFLCFTNWEAANFPVIDNIDRLTLNETDQNLLKEMEVEINRLKNPNQMMMYYKEFVSQYLEQGGYNFEWEGFAAHDSKLCMKADQPENLELLPVLGCYDNLIDGGKLQYFSVLDPDTGKGKENKLTKFGNAGYPLNFFVGEFIKKYSRDALPEDVLALLKEQAKIGLGLVDNSGTLESDR